MRILRIKIVFEKNGTHEAKHNHSRFYVLSVFHLEQTSLFPFILTFLSYGEGYSFTESHYYFMKLFRKDTYVRLLACISTIYTSHMMLLMMLFRMSSSYSLSLQTCVVCKGLPLFSVIRMWLCVDFKFNCHLIN